MIEKDEAKPKELDLTKFDCKLNLMNREIFCKVDDPEIFAEVAKAQPKKIHFDLVTPEGKGDKK